MRYFAYGSNMNRDRMKERIGHIPQFQSAILKYYRLMFNKTSLKADNEDIGFANIVETKNESDIVEGLLYNFTEDDFDKLDVYEGVKDGHYYKATVQVITNNRKDKGKQVEAITYISNRTKEGLKPPQWYLNHLLKGKDSLSDEYYKKLLDTKTL